MSSTPPTGVAAPGGRARKGRLILRGVTVIDGTGAPAYGPAELIVQDGRITAVVTPGNPTSPGQPAEWTHPGPDDEVVDLHGHFVMPGIVDAHAHIGVLGQIPSYEYVYRLWMGHGITTVREPGCFVNGVPFTVDQAQRSEAGQLVAPRILAFGAFGSGIEGGVSTPEQAARSVQHLAELGASGVKFFGAAPRVFEAAVREAGRLGLGTACHHAQQNVTRVDALTSARWGLSSIEHWYGLPEAMFSDRRVQNYPAGYNYLDEPARFASAGTLWEQAVEPGSNRWQDLLDELVSLGTTLDPTFNVYIGTRDAARVRSSEWHDDYTAPQLLDFWQPNPSNHGSFFADWGTEQEVVWRRNYRYWMDFVNDFKNRGGRVTIGSDSGPAYKVYGFGTIEEMELMREAGFHPLEVIRAATLAGAELLDIDEHTGTIEAGKRADLLVIDENPLSNLKVLYGHGHCRSDASGSSTRTRGVLWTIKDGVVHDAQALRSDVREIVRGERAARNTDES